ncbi:MAG: amidohydrolase family protein [Xanthobacteraceae bacterium]
MQKLTATADANVNKPKLVAPPGACDTHIHLFVPGSSYAPDSPYRAKDAPPEMFFELQKKLGLSTAVIVSPGGYGRDTSMLADVLAKHPQRFRGIALVKDDIEPSELVRLTRLGVKGMRMMSNKRGQHVPNFAPGIAAKVHEHGWHIQFYPHGTDITEYADKLLSLKNDIVLDHFASIPAEGGTDQPAMKAVMKMLDTGRVWLKLSGPMRCTLQNAPYPSVTPIARALVKHAPERLVWGSDWPHVNLDGREMPDAGILLDLLREWVPDEATRKRILVDNANRLYGF